MNSGGIKRWTWHSGMAAMLVTLTMLTGCEPRPYGMYIARSQGRARWYEQQAIKADIRVQFGGNEMLAGTMLFDPSVSKSRIEIEDGTVLVFDGQRAWISPPTAEAPMARFHLLSWPYFMAAPFKLHDEGSNLAPLGTGYLQGKRYHIARLTFDAGVGDAPDDWYILYRDPQTQRLAAMAYIVTYDKSVAEAEKEPHAVTFEDFQRLNGVTLATRWVFWNWSRDQGIHGEPIGEVTLSNIQFVKPVPWAYLKPYESREAPLPGHKQEQRTSPPATTQPATTQPATTQPAEE